MGSSNLKPINFEAKGEKKDKFKSSDLLHYTGNSNVAVTC